jgi:hypothetical protein
MQYKVIYVKHKMKGEKDDGFIGMNKNAARSPQIRMKYPYKKNVILIYDGLNPKQKKDTIKHEVVEQKLMENGFSYKKAHRASNVLESADFVKVKASKRARGYERRI